MRCQRIMLPVLAIWGLFAASTAGAAEPAGAESAVSDFTVLHITDMHVNPHLARLGKPEAVRGADCIAWVCQQAGKLQNVPTLSEPAPAPAFALATGDLTEYGVIDDTWQIVEEAFAKLPCPLYVLPGNHDNTWVALYDVMRKRHGGENHAFTQHGCRFICLSSASPQEPVPSLDGKTRSWLKSELENVPPGMPIFVALHHPPYVTEFAHPVELDTLVDLLRDYNVALLLYGHGHGVEHRDICGLDGVMGGSTFGKNAGYGLLSMQDGRLRYAYHYHRDPRAKGDEAGKPGWKVVLNKPLPRQPASRLFAITEPASDGHSAEGPTLTLALALNGPDPDSVNWAVRVDGNPVSTVVRPVESEGSTVAMTGPVPLDGLLPGMHLLTVQVTLQDGRSDQRTRLFSTNPPDVEMLWKAEGPRAIKAAPVVVGDLVVYAGNDGSVVASDRVTGQQRWVFKTGGEILGTPAWNGEYLVVGSGDGKVYALDGQGRQRWVYEAGRPVYGWPVIDGDTAFVGDNGGRMHAISLADGSKRWVFERADFSIESRPAVWKDLVVFGAWDGYLYAVDKSTGKLRWKSLGPKSSDGGAARYYAPADCGPIVVEEALFVCDRGYRLGKYDPDGKLVSTWDAGVAGIVPAADGRHFYARTTESHVRKYDGSGQVIWDKEVPAGRFPIPPTEQDGRLYICSNTGLLSVLDARDGKTLWQYQATPGFFVMAPVTVDAGAAGQEPACYVAGMDGSVTALRYRQKTRSTRQGT
ncbi:MAG: PQQ-binding-like beta-propeller repeat protein [Phycisphaerae bacterium]|nr:PQQ-binding-like beta-propeller repeat protein [Phycisphaerae bacterium]